MKSYSLKHKVVAITGASSGLGKELAISVAKEGATPILLARSKDKLEETAEYIQREHGIQAFSYELDVSNFSSIQATFTTIFTRHENIDILVNNAGMAIFEYFTETDLNDVKRMMDTNVLGVMGCSKAVLPHMQQKNQGHIVNIASQAGKIATPKSSVYAASKHAVLGFTNALRMELVHTNITVSAVNPGPIKTPFFDLADTSGTYVQNIEKYMLSSEFVAQKIVHLMKTKKRELNLPWWMNVGSKLYQLAPALVEKLGGKKFYQK